MWNQIGQSIRMVGLKMESKYLQELTSIKSKQVIIQTLGKWWPWSSWDCWISKTWFCEHQDQGNHSQDV